MSGRIAWNTQATFEYPNDDDGIHIALKGGAIFVGFLNSNPFDAIADMRAGHRKPESLSKWIVKDTEGEDIAIEADSWECGGNGLQFFVGESVVSWFTSWQHFREIVAGR